MPHCLALALALILVLLASCAAPAAGPDNLPARLEAVALRRMRLSRTPGVALALIRNGQVVWTQAYGMADVAAQVPVAPDSLFGVASISKTATAWGVMKLVEAGKIDLDAPVDTYLTRWHLPASQYDPSGVTIRRLLSHSAGLNTPEYLGYLPDAALPDIQTVLAAGDGRAPGVFIAQPPGGAFAYSDGGYLLLQLVVEEVTGEPFEVYMQREIIAALHIPDATFISSPEIEARTVTSYTPELEPLPHYRFVEKAPAGLYASAAGLAQLVAAAMPGPNGEPPGRGVLHPETVARMLAPQVGITGVERLIYAHGYGLGYYVESLPDGRRLVSHMGANLNGVTEFAAIPETGDGIVVLTTSMAGHEVFADVLAAWIDAAGPGHITLPRAIRTARTAMLAGAALLGGLAVWLAARLLSDLLRRRRTLAPLWSGPHLGRRLALLLAAAALLIGYFSLLHDFMLISMPSAAPWLAAGWTALCLALIAWSLSVPCSAQPEVENR